MILGFIGLKIISEALQESGVHRIGPLPVPQIGTWLSLAVIAGVLATVTVTSLLSTRRNDHGAQPGRTPPGSPGQPPVDKRQGLRQPRARR